MSERSLPEKPATDAPVSTAKGKGAVKGKSAPPPQRMAGALRLKEKESKAALPETAEREHRADQIEPKRRAERGEGYVRFRVHVDEDGAASVVGSHFVDSTLIEPTGIYGNFAYEVTEGDRRLHFDSIPDLGVFRSFVNPDGPPEERKHHIYELKTYDFDVRVPAPELAVAALPKVTITLYRVKEARLAMPVGIRPLNVQFERELREVARVDGISARVMPKAMQRRGKA